MDEGFLSLIIVTSNFNRMNQCFSFRDNLQKSAVEFYEGIYIPGHANAQIILCVILMHCLMILCIISQSKSCALSALEEALGAVKGDAC